MNEGAYEQLCDSLSLSPAMAIDNVSSYYDLPSSRHVNHSEVFAAALATILQMMVDNGDEGELIDRELIDRYIVQINNQLNDKVNAILHHPQFQAMEANWRSLSYLLQHAPSQHNIKVDILNISKAQLSQDFNDAVDVTRSGLYAHVYQQEYDMPGGEPFAAMIAAYDIDNSQEDMRLLKQVGEVASLAQCPFVAAVSEGFFQKAHIADVMMMEELSSYMDRAEYIAWQQFRESAVAKYVGLTLPKFMLRLPYERNHGALACATTERCAVHQDYLWGNAAFAFAANVLKSFIDNGWGVNIRGPESGGKVEDLPMHQYNIGYGIQTKIPIESLITESKELELANLGFIPLSYYKNSDVACFFSASSAHKPKSYLQEEHTANSRINAKLPYIFLSSRIAHYLKVLQRENIGAAKSAKVLENELNQWLQTLVTTMPNPQPDIIATHPLSEAYVEVRDVPDNPGFYRVELFVSPHFQIEGMDVLLSVVARLPAQIGN